MSAKLIVAESPLELGAAVQQALDSGYDLFLNTVVSRSSEGVYRLSQWMLKQTPLYEYRLLSMFDVDSLEKAVAEAIAQGFDLYHGHFYFDVYVCQWMYRFAETPAPATLATAQAEQPKQLNYVTQVTPLPWPIVNCTAVFAVHSNFLEGNSSHENE